MKTSLKLISSALAVGAVANAAHAAVYKPKKNETVDIIKDTVDVEKYKAHLSEAIKIKTISHRDESKTDWAEFERFHAFLDESYPLIAEKLEKEVIPPANLLYHWKGKDSSLNPIALLAHQDVVPVSDGTEDDWTHPAFSGHDDGEYIWGRGAIDMKNHLICVMEAVEALLEDGFEPERDVYLCFGDNEEIVANSSNGAKDLMNTLKSRGVELDCVLDEGGAMLPINVKGVINHKTLAGIGVAEKGYADIELAIKAKGGHSSSPPNHTAIGELSKAIVKLEKNQFDASFNANMKMLLDSVARNTTYPVRLITCNMTALRPLLLQVCKMIPAAACMVRTTTAVTMSSGSPSANVLPQKAAATVNFRSMPGTSTDSIVDHIKKVCKNPNLEVTVLNSKEASNFSPTDSRAFKIISGITASLENGAVVAPYLVMGGTDAYFYEDICQNVYRFAPFKFEIGLLSTMHGTNERIPVSCLEDAIVFFKNYVRLASDK